MKLSTDAVLLGVFAGVENARTILDIGTGSGILALMLAQRCAAEVTGIDMDQGSVEDARQNFENSPWESRLHLVHDRIQDHARSTQQKYDAIVSNPPYFENSKRSPYISRNQSKHTSMLSFRELIAITASLLNKNGSCSFILPADAESNFRMLASHAGLYLHRKMMIYPRKSKPHNRLLLEFKKENATPVKQESLIIRMEENTFSPEYKNYTRDFYLDF